MRVGHAHLTYCTNVHATEALPDLHRSLDRHVAAVKARISPSAPFGVGLWLSHRAASALDDPGELANLQRALAERGLYVFTLNGFPFGAFHGAPIKSAVYRPDWRDRQRLQHTDRLAELLAALLPPGVDGSISTLPGGFAQGGVFGADDEVAIAAHLLEHAAHLHALEARTGKRITLAIEPEPCCHLETTEQVVAFFEKRLRSAPALARLSALCGVSHAVAADIGKRHLGVCLDACHAAVEYEDPQQVLDELARAEIRVAKLQLSAGLRVARADADARAALTAFAEPVYLHQVVARRGDVVTRYLDLPDALASATPADGSRQADASEWRVHFHVPLHRARFGPVVESTQGFVAELLARQRVRPFTDHLEVETYTWDVLPEAERPAELSDGLAAELRFCLDALDGTPLAATPGAQPA